MNRFKIELLLGVTLGGLWLVGLATEPATDASTDEPRLATNAVEVARFDWFDQQRARNVPLKIYYPSSGAGPFPVIIFSHGLGGSREGYEYLGRCWASHGFVSVHVQHLGSDDGVWMKGGPGNLMKRMRKAATDLSNITNRPLDVSFAIDQLERCNREDSSLKIKLDLNRVGVAGHSFGAFTTLAVAGEVFPGPSGREVTFVDRRVKAAIAMSSPVAVIRSRLDKAYGSIQIPCLHMTGTKDSSPIGDNAPADRRIPFDHIALADQFLITFTDGDHMIFSGGGPFRHNKKDAAFQRDICLSSVMFWDAYLNDDPRAKAWLTGTGLRSAIGERGVVEYKPARQR